MPCLRAETLQNVFEIRLAYPSSRFSHFTNLQIFLGPGCQVVENFIEKNAKIKNKLKKRGGRRPSAYRLCPGYVLLRRFLPRSPANVRDRARCWIKQPLLRIG